MEETEWYALFVRPRFERVVAFHLESQNIEHCLPLRRITRQSASGIHSIEVPLLPGFVFSKTHSSMRNVLWAFSGVVDVVADAIPAQKISDLQRIMQTGMALQQWRFTPTGNTVTIEDGPLSGISGVLEKTPSNGEVFILSFDVIGRSVAVQINRPYSFSASRGTAAYAIQIARRL